VLEANRVTAVTTHWGNWDVLLVRTGHHLWKWHKQDRANKAFMPR
jgi:hypothetical protein